MVLSLSLYWCMYTGSSDDQYVRHWIDDCYRLGYRYILYSEPLTRDGLGTVLFCPLYLIKLDKT